MAGLKRTDNKGRILKDGETQRKDGTYRFTYTDADGVRHDVYSKRLVPTDRLPPGCKDDLCLREKERKINRDLEDGIKAAVENKAIFYNAYNIICQCGQHRQARKFSLRTSVCMLPVIEDLTSRQH